MALLKKLFFCLLLAGVVRADGILSHLNVGTQDAAINTYPYKIKFANGSVTDNGDGTVSIAGGGTSSLWYTFDAWGDSLTFGNSDGTGVSFPSALSTIENGNYVYNGGQGGQTSTQIGIRQGGISTTTIVTGSSIPANTSNVPISFPTGNNPLLSSNPNFCIYATITGIAGTACVANGSSFLFSRLVAGSSATVTGPTPFVVNPGFNNQGFEILWEGRNDGLGGSANNTAVANLTAQIAFLPTPKRYLLLSVINGEQPSEASGQVDYASITQFNTQVSTTFPSNYLDIRAYLVSQYNSGNAIDVLDHTNDVPPYSLRAQEITGTLTVGINASVTTFTTSNTPSPGDIYTIGSEFIKVLTASGNTVLTSSRGYAGSTAASYLNGQAFTGVDPLHLSAAGYTLIASTVAVWIANHDVGVGNGLYSANAINAIFSEPPSPILNANISSGTIGSGAGLGIFNNVGIAFGTTTAVSPITLKAPATITLLGSALNFRNPNNAGFATMFASGDGSAAQFIGGLVPHIDNYGGDQLGYDSFRWGSLAVGNANSSQIGNIFFPTSGNVGIGTNAPSSSLHVVSGTANTYETQFSTSVASFHVAISTNGHMITNGPIPAVSSCGVSPSVAAGSTDVNGFINTGSGVFASCTMTFASPFVNKPSCVIEDDSNVLASPPKVTTTTTTMIIAGVTITPSDVLNYICFGN